MKFKILIISIFALITLFTGIGNKTKIDENETVLSETDVEISKNEISEITNTNSLDETNEKQNYIQEKTFEARYRKAIETEKYYMPFFKKCRQLYPRYENLFYAARTQIHPLIFEIKSFYSEIEKLRAENVKLRSENEKK